MRPYSRFHICLKAVRAQFFSVSFIPVLLAAALAGRNAVSVQWHLLPLFILTVALMHSGTNLINDYYDFRNGVDKPGACGSGCVLVEGLISPRQARAAAYLCFAAALIPGLLLVRQRGVLLLLMGAAGFIGGYGYTGRPFGFKYIALGEIIVFLMLGPLLVSSAYFTLSGSVPLFAVYISIPVGLLTAAILHSNNLRDLSQDKAAGIRTMALYLGLRGARAEYYLLILGAYSSIPLLYFSGIAPPAAFLTWLTLPAAVSAALRVRAVSAGFIEGNTDIDVRTAALHFAFGLLYSGSFYLPSFAWNRL